MWDNSGPPIADLWDSIDPEAWNHALGRYWCFVKPDNIALEKSLDTLDLDMVRRLDAQGWFDFLLKEYFRWKYTQPNRYKTTTNQLRKAVERNGLAKLDKVRAQLLALNLDEIAACLSTACKIPGLGVAGGSGLLSLMYPHKFGTVDQFVVKALRDVRGLPEAQTLEKMNPENLRIQDGIVLTIILRRKAVGLNRLFDMYKWTPRDIEKILWTYGR